MINLASFAVAGSGEVSPTDVALSFFKGADSTNVMVLMSKNLVGPRLSSLPGGTGFFASALPANPYVLLLVMAIPAAALVLGACPSLWLSRG